MRSEELLTESEAAILEIGHSYRNPAYHQGHHNPRSVRVVSVMLLGPIGELLQKAFANVSAGGFGQIRWLQDYGVSSKPLVFEDAAKEIMTQLANGLQESLDLVKEALSEDIVSRLANLDRVLHDEWIGLPPDEWDDVLKQAQFVERFDDERASKEYRELVYRITGSERATMVSETSKLPLRSPVSRSEFTLAEAAYKERYGRAFAAFEPSVRLSELEDLGKGVSKLQEARSERILVGTYRKLDERLTVAEDAFAAARFIVDVSTQYAIDLKRGK